MGQLDGLDNEFILQFLYASSDTEKNFIFLYSVPFRIEEKGCLLFVSAGREWLIFNFLPNWYKWRRCRQKAKQL